MSGSYSQFVQQQVPVNYQAWQQPSPEPFGDQSSGSQWTPNFLYGGAQVGNPILSGLLETILVSWQAPDPLPTLPRLGRASTQVSGSTFSVYAPAWQNVVLQSWVPPDPLPTLPAFQFGKHFTPSGPPQPPAPVPGNLVNVPHGVAANGAVPVYITTNSVYNGMVPRAGTNSVITAGGVAVIAVTGPCNGAVITNGDAAAQGVSAEILTIDLTQPPPAGDANAVGTTFTIATSASWSLPAPLAAGAFVWVNAVTAGHRFSVYVW